VVEVAQRLLRIRDEPQRLCAALPERAFVTGLLPQRLVASPTRTAAGSERTHPAARDPRETHGGAQVHEGLRGRGRKAVPRPFLHSAHVRVDGQDILAQREVANCRGGVRPDSRELRQILRPALRRHLLCGAVKVEAAPVVAQSLPGTNDVRHRRRGEGFGRRPALQPLEVPREDPLDLRLLQHDLRDENRVRISRPSPGQVAAVLCEPGEQGGLHGSGL
jgi:hypothetical protein